jgi:short subunit dehydrogenase-like uncharacterized protein
MLVESGLCLALQSDLINCGGGVWTPACCQGSVLTKRLIESGCILEMNASSGVNDVDESIPSKQEKKTK